MHKNKVAGGVAALSATALMVLTACGGNDDPQADAATPGAPEAETTVVESGGGSFFDFTHPQLTDAEVGPADEIRLVIPGELLEATREYGSEYAEDRVLEAITVRAGEHPDSQCAVEVEYEYAEGARDRIEGDRYVAYVENSDDAIDLERAGAEIVDSSPYWEYEAERNLYSYPDAWKYTSVLYSVAEHLEDDGERAVVPVSCASSPGAGDKVEVGFNTYGVNPDFNIDDPRHGWMNSHTVGTFAVAEIWAMASGDIGIADWEVDGFGWTANEQTGEVYGWIPDGYSIDSQGNLIED